MVEPQYSQTAWQCHFLNVATEHMTKSYISFVDCLGQPLWAFFLQEPSCANCSARSHVQGSDWKHCKLSSFGKFSGLEQVTLPSNLQNLVFGFWFDQSLAGLLCQSFCKALNSVTCSIRALVGWRCEVVCRLWFLAIALTKASMKHDENTKQRKKWLTIYVTSIHCQYTNWWNFHVNGSEFSPINKIEQRSLATTSMITTATKLMAHFMLDCSSKEVSPSHSKSSAPANASINASVTTKNSLRSACMARLLKSTTNVWIYSSKTNKVNS